MAREDFEVRDERGSRASRRTMEAFRAGAALGVVVVLAVIMGALAWASCATGCGSALADQCEALYAGAQQASAAAHTESEVADARARTAAADAACGADGGAP